MADYLTLGCSDMINVTLKVIPNQSISWMNAVIMHWMDRTDQLDAELNQIDERKRLPKGSNYWKKTFLLHCFYRFGSKINQFSGDVTLWLHSDWMKRTFRLSWLHFVFKKNSFLYGRLCNQSERTRGFIIIAWMEENFSKFYRKEIFFTGKSDE